MRATGWSSQSGSLETLTEESFDDIARKPVYELDPSSVTITALHCRRGGFSVVSKGEHFGEEVAIKHLQLPELEIFQDSNGTTQAEALRKMAMREVAAMMQTANHQSLIQLKKFTLEANATSQNGHLIGPALVLPWYADSLHNVLHSPSERLTPASIAKWMKGIAHALDTMHSPPIPLVHLDVKPGNILLTSDRRVAVLADLGLCMQSKEGKAGGTLMYSAPEVIEGEPPTPAADTYSFALVLFHLLTRRQPWDGLDRREIVKRIDDDKRPKWTEADDDNIPEALQRLVEDCWVKETTKRPSMRTVARRLGEYLQRCRETGATSQLSTRSQIQRLNNKNKWHINLNDLDSEFRDLSPVRESKPKRIRVDGPDNSSDVVAYFCRKFHPSVPGVAMEWLKSQPFRSAVLVGDILGQECFMEEIFFMRQALREKDTPWWQEPRFRRGTADIEQSHDAIAHRDQLFTTITDSRKSLLDPRISERVRVVLMFAAYSTEGAATAALTGRPSRERTVCGHGVYLSDYPEHALARAASVGRTGPTRIVAFVTAYSNLLPLLEEERDGDDEHLLVSGKPLEPPTDFQARVMEDPPGTIEAVVADARQLLPVAMFTMGGR